MDHIDKSPWQSKKFLAHLVTLGVLAALGVLALVKGADASLYTAVSVPIMTLAMGSIGSIAWVDRGVRMEGLRAAKGAAAVEPPKAAP